MHQRVNSSLLISWRSRPTVIPSSAARKNSNSISGFASKGAVRILVGALGQPGQSGDGLRNGLQLVGEGSLLPPPGVGALLARLAVGPMLQARDDELGVDEALGD